MGQVMQALAYVVLFALAAAGCNDLGEPREPARETAPLLAVQTIEGQVGGLIAKLDDVARRQEDLSARLEALEKRLGAQTAALAVHEPRPKTAVAPPPAAPAHKWNVDLAEPVPTTRKEGGARQGGAAGAPAGTSKPELRKLPPLPDADKDGPEASGKPPAGPGTPPAAGAGQPSGSLGAAGAGNPPGAPPATAADTGPQPVFKPGDLTVVNFKFAAQVDRKLRQPTKVEDTFSLADKTVYAWLVLSNKSDGDQTVDLVWKREGKKITSIPLQVGRKSSHWRTWSHIVLSPKSAGNWDVEVVAPGGLVIDAKKFSVAP